ncbi:MAG: alpha/beta hydrolase [Bacteroidota bacterium]
MALIHFSHANGFPADSYQHFFQYLSPHTIHYVPVMGVGQYQVRKSWRPLAQEIIEDIEANCTEAVVGLGHSMGAVAVFWAAIERPDLFRQIIMMDAPIFGWRLRTMMAISRFLKIQDRIVPIIKKAKKRRDHFDSKEQALAYFQSKRLFKYFAPTSIQEYVDYGLKASPQGGLELVIPKTLEAKMFSCSPIRIGSTKLEVPSHFLYATKGVLPARALSEHQQRFDRTTFQAIEGGHMFPLEKPEELGALIHQLIKDNQPA